MTRPLTIRPGKYRTREGKVATITAAPPGYQGAWRWEGEIGGSFKQSWKSNGEASCIPNNPHQDDLIARIEDQTPRKRTAKARERSSYLRTKCEVYISCESLAVGGHIKQLIERVVGDGGLAVSLRRLPLAQRRNGKGARK